MNDSRAVRVIVWLFSVFLTSNAFAITDEEIFRNFQFSFVNPGARSSAMGGAFIGLADDATAAEANPAGLTILTKPEVSFEYRYSEFDSERLNAINAVQDPSAQLALASFNTLDELNQPSFLSVVFPSSTSTYAFSRQEVVRQEGGLDEVFAVVFADGSELDFGTTARTDQKIVNWNFSFASKLTDNFSVGATLRYSQLQWEANVTNFIFVGNDPLLAFQTDIDDDDSAFAYNFGMHYRLGSYVGIGAVYKKNPKFEVEEVESGPVAPNPGPFTNTFNVPDTIGFGISIKPNDRLTVVADVVRVQYSDLEDDLVSGRNILTFGFTPQEIAFGIDDATDFNIGTEFIVFLGNVPVALRQGYYRRSASTLVVKSSTLSGADQNIFDVLFPEREDENHFTFGNGFVFGQNFQVDWALDLSNLADTFVLSTVVRF